MKKINKNTLDELIRTRRKYYKTGDTDIFEKSYSLCKEITFEIGKPFIYATYINDIVDATINLKIGATNCDIYKIFEILGCDIE